jgi:hypothetical protein
MQNEFWTKVDAYLFRFLGIGLGGGGCAALLLNNPPEKVFHSIYGALILAMFVAMGGYSLFTMIVDLIGKKE